MQDDIDYVGMVIAEDAAERAQRKSADGRPYISMADMQARYEQPPALGGEPEVVGYGYRNTMVGRSPAMMDLRPDIPAGDQYSGQLWSPLVTLDDHRAHIAPLLAEVESERSLRRDLAARVGQLSDENKDLRSRIAELESTVALDDRMEFEAWADQKGFCLDSSSFAEGNNFIADDTRLAFDIWMARAALNKPAGVRS